MSIQSIKNKYHFLVALAANIYYQYPSRTMKVVGVTGTDGKTTTSSMIAHVLQKQGFKTALITTVGVSINGHFHETGFHTTTPSSFYLQKYLSSAKKAGCTHAVIEVTSHALDQHRAFGISFDVGVITNITHEHLDYHKTMDNYIMAKAKLLKNSSVKILNFDDNAYSLLKKYVPDVNRYYYSLKHSKSYTNPDSLPTSIKKLGEFNMQNALAAASSCMALGVPSDAIKDALESFQLPEGRLELIHENNFKVFVDFAHTPNSFQRLLPTLREGLKGRLIHVFGAAGKRDTSKRKLMGEVASFFDDVIVLTAEDPRGEDVHSICEEISKGFSGFKQIDPNLIQFKDNKYFVIIPDRKRAIQFAVSRAQKGDVIVVSGKGHEKSMNITGTEEAWSDKEAILETTSSLK